MSKLTSGHPQSEFPTGSLCAATRVDPFGAAGRGKPDKTRKSAHSPPGSVAESVLMYKNACFRRSSRVFRAVSRRAGRPTRISILPAHRPALGRGLSTHFCINKFRLIPRAHAGTRARN